jgi:hypothetical protein
MDEVFVLFGKETKGLPEDVLVKYIDKTIRIPMRPTLRSLNLSNSVSIVVYDILRQKEFENLEQEKFADEFPKMKFSIAKTSKLFKLRQDKFPMLYLRKFITEMEKEGVVDYNNENDNPYGILITKMSNTEKENKDIENLIGTHLKDAVIRDKKKDKKKYNQWDDWKVQYRNKLPT